MRRAVLDTVAAIVIALTIILGAAFGCAVILGLIYAWARFAQLLLGD